MVLGGSPQWTSAEAQGKRAKPGSKSRAHKRARARRGIPEGPFVLVEGRAKVENRIAKAVDRAVADLNVVVRGIARGRLLDSTPAIPRVAFESDRRKIVVVLGPRRLATFRGKSRRVENAGYDIVLSQRFKKSGVLEQVMAGEQGTRVNKFWLRKDGRLAMRSVISSDRLPEPVVFTVLYEPAKE